MKKILFTLLLLAFCSIPAEAQKTKTEQVKYIREAYADAKQRMAENGKNGMAPLDVTISISNGTRIDEDFILDEENELTFHFYKHRENQDLSYPDASICYFITENWTSHGHTRYREILFDPHEGCLLFCYMRGETDAGFVVETRYYYDEKGNLVDQKHKAGGHDADPDIHSWNDGESEKAQAMSYLNVFDLLMNDKDDNIKLETGNAKATPKAERMEAIRNAYALAKKKVAAEENQEEPHNMHIVIRDQSWGPPMTQELNYYFENLSSGEQSGYRCYFISEHRHHHHMGPESYGEYLFEPQSQSLIFSYSSAREEGQKHDWRYYYDENGNCIETISNAEETDNGHSDRLAAKRYLAVFNAIEKATM